MRVSGNVFGTAATHRCLGVVFILGAPLTVTAIALLETGRLKRRYGIRLKAHPATLAPMPGPVPPVAPTVPPGMPPHVPPQQNPYGNPYAPNPQPPYNPQFPYRG